MGIDPGQGASEALERIFFSNEGDLTWPADLRPQPIADPETSATQCVHGNRDLVLRADASPTPSPCILYFFRHE
jgi:hypothetical protein